MTEEQQKHKFDEWITLHRALLFKVIRSYADTEVDRNDLFQEIAIQVYRSVPNFKGNSSVVTWMYRIALNTAIKWLTKEKKHSKNHESIQSDAPVIATNYDFEYEEKVEWLYKTIKTFEEVERSMSLLLLDGYSYKEIAEIVGISESNVGVKIHRIKKKLMVEAKKIKGNGI
jgi:RNA polymerase sigma-70 factor (ECF subfamily)